MVVLSKGQGRVVDRTGGPVVKTYTGNGGNLSKLRNSPVREWPAAGEWSPTKFGEVNGWERGILAQWLV